MNLSTESFEAEGLFKQLDRWPNLERRVSCRVVDHTVRPIVAQVAVHTMLDRELERLLRD